MPQDIFKQVEENIDNLVDNQVWWANCATEKQIRNARNGKIDLSLGSDIFVPYDWISDVRGKNVLCLAGAGGLQAPILAASGANVTVIDLSLKMLEKDKLMADKYSLNIITYHGNMQDLAMFEDGSFDYIITPVSLCYVPNVMPVFKECYRVLKKNGTLIIAAPNPIMYVCNFIDDENGGYYKAVNRMPYSSILEANNTGWVEFGHTMEDYLGGQIKCGFIITGYIEHQREDITDLSFISKAVKQ